MRKYYLILLQSALSIFLISSLALAAPTLNGRFDSDEWTYSGTSFSSVTIGGDYTTPRHENAKAGFTANASQFFVDGVGKVGPGTGGVDFDVQFLGVYIDDNYLYFGLQTGFDLRNGVYSYTAGDIAIDFSSSLNDTPDFEFGIDLDDKDPATTSLWNVNSWTNPVIAAHNAAAPYQIADKGDLIASETSWYDWKYMTEEEQNNVNYFAYYSRFNPNVLEGKIKLSLLQDQLASIDIDGTSDYYVTLHWTMGCGNDYLNKTIAYTAPGGSNAVPEPATLLLFGMGLLGAGAYGRKRQKKEEK